MREYPSHTLTLPCASASANTHSHTSSASSSANEYHVIFQYTLPRLLCGPQVIFANSDTLVGRNLGVDNRGGNWTHLVKHFDPDIILISAGPHINRPMPLRSADMRSVIEQVAVEHRALFPEKTLIWKTQAPGGCTRNISNTIPEPAFFDSLPYDHFNQEQYDEWDWMAIDVFARQPNQHVLDLTPLYYRTDAHPGCHYYEGYRVDSNQPQPMTPSSVNPPLQEREGEGGGGGEGYTERRDCLHHCIPGPIGLLPQLLLHLFEVQGI